MIEQQRHLAGGGIGSSVITAAAAAASWKRDRDGRQDTRQASEDITSAVKQLYRPSEL